MCFAARSVTIFTVEILTSNICSSFVSIPDILSGLSLFISLTRSVLMFTLNHQKYYAPKNKTPLEISSGVFKFLI